MFTLRDEIILCVHGFKQGVILTQRFKAGKKDKIIKKKHRKYAGKDKNNTPRTSRIINIHTGS